MLIENTMDLSQLGDRMSHDVTTTEEQRAMRNALLNAGYAGTDTSDVPVSVWESFLEAACG